MDHLSTLTKRTAVDPTNAVGVIVNATIALDWGKRFRVWNVLLLAVRQFNHTVTNAFSAASSIGSILHSLQVGQFSG